MVISAEKLKRNSSLFENQNLMRIEFSLPEFSDLSKSKHIGSLHATSQVWGLIAFVQSPGLQPPGLENRRFVVLFWGGFKVSFSSLPGDDLRLPDFEVLSMSIYRPENVGKCVQFSVRSIEMKSLLNFSQEKAAITPGGNSTKKVNIMFRKITSGKRNKLVNSSIFSRWSKT